jgi:hypothetical protein
VQTAAEQCTHLLGGSPAARPSIPSSPELIHTPEVPIAGHPVPGPQRHRSDTMGNQMEASLNAFAITFADRMPTKTN